jgi:hypothetical protein
VEAIHNVDKQKAIYTYTGILFSPKKEGFLSHATTQMTLDHIMLSETSQS